MEGALDFKLLYWLRQQPSLVLRIVQLTTDYGDLLWKDHVEIFCKYRISVSTLDIFYRLYNGLWRVSRIVKPSMETSLAKFLKILNGGFSWTLV